MLKFIQNHREITALLADENRRKEMIRIQKETVRTDSCQRICDMIEELVK